MAPRSTYRLQFREDFTFDDAAALVPYLRRLGVSHLYASPLFQAHPGSTHGYDVVDYGAFNPELGGAEAFDRLASALAANGLKLLLDVVPNHMGVGGADNAFWLDMLEWGEEADHAGWFDVDWTSDRADIRGKVLVPLLGDQYGSVLETGGLTLRFDADEGGFAVWAHDAHKLPISPLHYETVLGTDDRRLASLGDAFADLMRWRPQVMRRARDLKADLAAAARDPGVAAAIAARIDHFTGTDGDLESWAPLAALIAAQNWRPAHFLVASDDINYRRFFNIATLAGIRMELPDVFEHVHTLVFAMMRDGVLDGLRIDHVDGLFDPKAYLDRLRAAAPGGPGFYLLVEKILGPDEALRSEWPVDGTTGYDFTNLLTSLFVDNATEADFSRIYRNDTGETHSFETIIFDAKLQIVDNEMSSELHRLARAATRIARQNARTADFTLTTFQRALRLLVASFPVYRTYVDGQTPPTDEDRRQIDRAIAAALHIDTAIEPSVFKFLRSVLTGDLADAHGEGYRRSDIFRCAMKLQQYCGPVMAKGVEDTAFYRYNRFVALNEVGGSPDRFGISIDHFHGANAVRARDWPDAMLATSTHDTKRGEDTRARLAALSTMPDTWERQVRDMSAILEETLASPVLPDRNDRYMIFQLMVGAWPADFVGAETLDVAALDEFADRLGSVVTKSLREAKRHTTWTAPDKGYEGAAMAFIDTALRGAGASRFLDAFRPFADLVAAKGARNSFAQTVLKFTVPGMPDIYQGADLWDLTMVDPDNRRPIAYAAHEAALDDIERRWADDPGDAMTTLWTGWRDGRFKLALTRRLLALRQTEPALLARGDYEAAVVEGPGGGDICAFLRRTAAASLLVVARRFPRDGAAPARLRLPAGLGGDAEGITTGRPLALASDQDVEHMLGGYPAGAWLIRH